MNSPEEATYDVFFCTFVRKRKAKPNHRLSAGRTEVAAVEISAICLKNRIVRRQGMGGKRLGFATEGEQSGQKSMTKRAWTYDIYPAGIHISKT